jgi:hypothetical protein
MGIPLVSARAITRAIRGVWDGPANQRRGAQGGLARTFNPDVLIGEWQEDMQERVDAGELSANTLST